MLGGIDHQAEPLNKMDGFGRALEKKVIIVRRTSLVRGGHRLRYPGSGSIEF